MCKYTNQACPGGWITQTSSYTSWYCPLGNDYVCCQNAGPSANAGSPQTITLPTNSVTLSGSCSDADADSRNLKSCTWTKDSGPAASIQSPTSGSTNVTGLAQGTYTFRLTASDGYATASDTVGVTVNAAPIPTVTNTPTPTRTPTPTPTLTPTATPVPGTKLSLTLFLHGIGKAGDSVKPGEAGGGNMSPTHPNRVVRVEVFNSQNTKVKSVETTVNFDANSGSFKGVADVGSLASGNYLVRAKFSQSLDTQIGGIQVLSAQVNNNLPAQYFVTGDVNNDGAVSLNVLDFNTIIGCVGGNSCSTEQKIQSDLDDNGRVDVFDFNLFIREITHVL